MIVYPPIPNGVMPSVLGRFFVDAQFMLANAGLIAQPPQTTLTFQGFNQMLMADTTLVTTDDMQDWADSNAPILPAPYVINQLPAPNTPIVPGSTVQLTPAQLAIGYAVPTSQGPIPVP